MELSDIWKISFKKIAQTDVRPRTMPCPDCKSCLTCNDTRVVPISSESSKEESNKNNLASKEELLLERHGMGDHSSCESRYTLQHKIDIGLIKEDQILPQLKKWFEGVGQSMGVNGCPETERIYRYKQKKLHEVNNHKLCFAELCNVKLIQKWLDLEKQD